MGWVWSWWRCYGVSRFWEREEFINIRTGNGALGGAIARSLFGCQGTIIWLAVEDNRVACTASFDRLMRKRVTIQSAGDVLQ
jgi:hypothetical protein